MSKLEVVSRNGICVGFRIEGLCTSRDLSQIMRRALEGHIVQVELNS